MFFLGARRGFKLVLLKLLAERNGTLDESEKRGRPRKKKREKGRKRREKKGKPRGTKQGEKDKNLANGGTHPLNYNGHVVALQCFPWSVRGEKERERKRIISYRVWQRDW